MEKKMNHTEEPVNNREEGYEEIAYEAGTGEAVEDEYYEEAVEGEYYEEAVEGEYYEEAVEGEYYEEADGGEYYEEAVEGEYYEEAVEGEYYEEAVEGEYYEDAVEGEYYEETDGGEYYEEAVEGEYYEETAGDEYYGEAVEGEYYEEQVVYEERPSRTPSRSKAPKKRSEWDEEEEELDEKVGAFFRNISITDVVMVITGVAVLVLAVIVGSVFLKSRTVEQQVSDFVSVGTQLEGISVIGGAGIEAVAEAEKARLEAVTDPEPDQGGYSENDYDRQISVAPNFTSIQKDLKIKFVNQKNAKLVPNVPFSVVVTDPDGNELIWSDDDMDGIIYKKDIVPGTYKVVMEKLADSRYSAYTIAAGEVSAQVKKEISYSKVDVSDEVKQESEIDANKEDTKKKETEVESTLVDTVEWVESKVYPVTYNEVGKVTIPDPLTLVLTRNLVVTSMYREPDMIETEPGTEPTMPPAPEPTPVPVPEPTALPTPVPTESPVPTPAPTPVPPRGNIRIESTGLTGLVGSTLETKASAAGFLMGQSIVYSIESSDATVATATIDADGNIRISALKAGNATFTVKVNYQNGSEATEAVAYLSVIVGDKKTIALDKTTMNVYVNVPAVIKATIGNAIAKEPTVTAESSDVNIAAVDVKGTEITVIGIAEGTANVTVKYMENGEEVAATCAVTVKKHPSVDTVSLLKDASGQQLYVFENNRYREATYADYYTAGQFFVKGEAKYTGWQTLNGKVYYFTKDGVKVVGEQIIQGAKYNFANDGSLITGTSVVGIDVSKWNGTIDWDAVKNSGISYVIIRCGYRGSSNGKLVVDPKYEANIKGASEAGLKIGVYFFSQAVDEVEAVEEASMVLDLIKNYKISYPVFLDVEASGGRGDKIDSSTRTAVCKAFCETIQSAGYMPGIYSNKIWLEKKMNATQLSEYKIWLAQYAASPTYSGKFDIWQYKADGCVSGINGDVDLNISYLGY